MKGASAFEKAVSSPAMLEQARKVASLRVCDSCLGRQFGMVSTGLSNESRGRMVRKAAAAGPFKGRCSACLGLFQGGLEKLAAKAIKALKGTEYRTFVVGSRPGKKLITAEEAVWNSAGIDHCEPLKTEFNREMGKLLERKTGKRADELNPDVLVLFELENGKVDITKSPVYVYGEYQKLVRGIPQTKWEMYKTSVEDIIAKPLMKATKGKAHALHGGGREDIDAICLAWRPFVLEITGPVKRRLGLALMQKEINKSPKVNVRKLRYATKKDVGKVKAARHDKTYRMLVSFQRQVSDDDLAKLPGLAGPVRQKTPQRVVHRRADKTRKRHVYKVEWKKLTNKKIELVIKGEAGLYVKELVSGDDGRTEPSVSGMLENPARVLELDVIRIHGK